MLVVCGAFLLLPLISFSTAVCLYLSNGKHEELKEFFDKLSDGAIVTDPLKEMFFEMLFLVGRAGFEPATVRFLRVSLVGWVIPTFGRHLQRLRQPITVLS